MENWQKGQIAHQKVILRAIEKGILVSEPIQHQARYDLVLDDGTLRRAQIKYAGRHQIKASGAVNLDLRKMGCSREYRTYDDNDFDVLLVYVPDIDQIVMFEREVWSGKGSISIRFETPRNGQKKNIILAKDYIW